MTALQLLPAALALLLLAAHFLRSGSFARVGIVLVILGLLAVRRSWAARIVQAVLLLGTIEWIRTLIDLSAIRTRAGEPAARMAVILGSVALWTALAALLMESRRLGRRFGRERNHRPE